MISGCKTMRLTTSSAVVAMLACCGLASANRNGTIVNRILLSKQKISGAGPSVASASPGPRDGRLRDIAVPSRHADSKRQREGPERPQCGGEDEVDLGNLFERGLGQDAIEQGRQRHVEDEEIHPGQCRYRGSA